MNITELLLNAGMTVSNEPAEPRDPNDFSVSDMFYEENNDILAEDFDDYSWYILLHLMPWFIISTCYNESYQTTIPKEIYYV